jgi:hypothetical protein
MTFQEAGCVRANRGQVGPWEQWFFIEMGNNQFRVKSGRTDYLGYLGAYEPGHDTNCGGEVQAMTDADNPDKIVWELRQQPNDSDSSGGVNIGEIIGTVVDIATAVAAS